MLKPQPINLTGILNRRRRSRAMRQEQQEQLTELRQDLNRERDFERRLAVEAGKKFPAEVSAGFDEMSES